MTEYAERIRQYRDEIITFTVGIGDSPLKAEQAMFEAKNSKHKLYNIKAGSHGGKDTPAIDSRVSAILELRKMIDHSQRPLYERTEMHEGLNSLLMDSKTGLHNHLGMSMKLADNPGKYCCIILDGNNMHSLNEKLGYSAVDDVLAASGKAISSAEQLIMDNIRSCERRKLPRGKDRRRSDAKDRSFVAGRKHETGDEFIIMIPMEYDPVKAHSITRRILKRIYEAQIDHITGSAVQNQEFSLQP